MIKKKDNSKDNSKYKKNIKYPLMAVLFALFFGIPMVNNLFLPLSMLFSLKAIRNAKKDPKEYGGVWIAIICIIFSIISYTKISVVIPCYNEEKNIAKCLDAVYSLDYPKENIEVIVVDDGSPDSTIKTLEDYKKRNKNHATGMIISRGKHEGKSASLNIGINKAHHEIILTLDADTIVEKDSLRNLVRPFSDREVGATNGSFIPSNRNSLLGLFQNIEYSYYNLVKKSFSSVFRNGIWFFGAFTCYRKEALKKIGYFKKDSMTEDMDATLEIYSKGYRLINVFDAVGYTIVPSSIISFFRQRTRWWIGGLQAMKKNLKILSVKSAAHPKISPSIIFVFINQYWWSIFSVLFFPLIIYQVFYWLPQNAGFFPIFAYLFRWFSLLGPVYVIYKIHEWGISLYSIFGVMSGIMSCVLLIISLLKSRARTSAYNLLMIMFGVFFYFPYTIILNTITVISLIKLAFLKKKHFIY
ncbi:MAG: glycosyltransferase [Candidatus Woesearchaeota archaeon]|nr:glycosyltransferase [Candidatus Woesearchaeota archaeon]